MYFGFYTGLGLNMGMPYFGGFGFGCCNSFYNPLSLCQYTPNWFTLNSYIQPNLSWNYSPFYSNTYTPLFPSFSSSYEIPSFSFSSMTIPIGYSAAEMLKSGSLESAKTNQTSTSASTETKANQVQSSSSTSTTSAKTTSEKASQTVSSPFEGYNEEAGKRLAEIAMNNSDGFHNQCSTHVNDAIAQANLGSKTDLDAYQMFDQMRSNQNFKEISASTDTSSLKVGTVLIYDKGVSGYGDYGHIEIALGDGRAVSDGVTEKIKANPSAIFIPTSA